MWNCSLAVMFYILQLLKKEIHTHMQLNMYPTITVKYNIKNIRVLNIFGQSCIIVLEI